MTFQNVVNTKLTKYFPGDITRENPIDILSFFAEDENCKAGGFAFSGTNPEEQVKGILSGATATVGVIKRTPYQANITGTVSNTYIEGSELTVVRKGYIAVAMNSAASYEDNVFVDPTTGLINASSESSVAASAGSLNFANVDATISSWTPISNGDLSLKIDGVEVNLSSLDFSSVASMENVASVVNTALSTNGSCTYAAETGLTITSKTTGSSSTVEFVNSTNLASLLGNGISINGANAMINTGWKVNASCNAGEITEIYNI